ncbi:MAG: hypothetical protein FWD85_01495 [Microbacteriaceae bacterium]|nr:hypothetical protein [Microbacteriaceae bacterium]
MTVDEKPIKYPGLPVLDGWVNLTEAAELLGITRQHAYKKLALAAAGKSGGWKSARRVGSQNTYVVSRPEIDELLAAKGAAVCGVSEAIKSSSAKKILHVDLDNTLVDFGARLEGIDPGVLDHYDGRYDEIPGIFAVMPPVVGAINAFTTLAEHFEIFILSTAPWGNPSAWQHKVEWVQLHFGFTADSPAYKRLTLTHRKDLSIGDFLVDDRPTKNGADRFTGEVIAFGSDDFPDWTTVTAYLLARA